MLELGLVAVTASSAFALLIFVSLDWQNRSVFKQARHGAARRVTARHGASRRVTARHGASRRVTARHGASRCATAREHV